MISTLPLYLVQQDGPRRVGNGYGRPGSVDVPNVAQLWSQSDVEFNQSPTRVIVDVIGDSSLISPYFFVYF